MLIEKRYVPEINDIVTVKLISGEEIIGKVVAQTISSIVLSRPFSMVMQRVGPQEVVQAFAPVFAAIDPSDKIDAEIPIAAMAIKPVKAGPHAVSSYIEATTGLVTKPDSLFKA